MQCNHNFLDKYTQIQQSSDYKKTNNKTNFFFWMMFKPSNVNQKRNVFPTKHYFDHNSLGVVCIDSIVSIYRTALARGARVIWL